MKKKIEHSVSNIVRGAIGGKTGKTWVLPEFCKIERSGGSGTAPLCNSQIGVLSGSGVCAAPVALLIVAADLGRFAPEEHPRRGQMVARIEFLQLRWIFSLKAISGLNWQTKKRKIVFVQQVLALCNRDSFLI